MRLAKACLLDRDHRLGDKRIMIMIHRHYFDRMRTARQPLTLSVKFLLYGLS
jgi:hypothetical protein